MKIALVHDYLREYGGAERVVETLHEIWPEAPLYTAFVDWKSLGDHSERFKNWDIRTSWVQKNPIVRKFHSPLRFLAPKIWESFDLSDFDVVISSSGWYMSRGVKINSKFKIQNSKLQLKTKKLLDKKTLHICYIHHPPRNLYGYPTGSDLGKYWPVRVYATVVNFFLRNYDFETAQKVDYFIANSQETKRRVWKFYRREAEVIYPPIEIKDSGFKIQDSGIKTDSYYLSVGRLVWSKRVDLAIEACNKLKLPLKIAGSGKDEKYLKSIAGPTVEFMGSVSDKELTGLYQNAKALIFCALDEDFGMVPVEAMAAGTPVIALNQGGVRETVVDGKTGILFENPETDSLKIALQKMENSNGKWRTEIRKNCIMQSQKFSKDRFKREIKEFVESKYQNRNN